MVEESNESWEDAAQNALKDTDETLDGISGIEIVEQTADVGNGQIDRYEATVHVAFELQR